MGAYEILSLFLQPIMQYLQGSVNSGVVLPQLLMVLGMSSPSMPLSMQNDYFGPLDGIDQYQTVQMETGLVMDEMKQPVAGARVVVYVRDSMQQKMPMVIEKAVETETDGEGKYSVDIYSIMSEYGGEPFVVIQKEGYGLGWADWYEIDSTIVLKQPAVLEGSVIDQNGNYISGAYVHALLLVPDKIDSDMIVALSSTDLLTVMTDGYGRFSISNIPVDATAEFFVQGPENSHLPLMTMKPDETASRGQFKAGELEIDLRVSAATSSIHCTVIDQENGSAQSEIVLLVSGRSFNGESIYMTLTTEADGTVKIPVVAGSFSISLLDTFGSSPWSANPVLVNIGENENTFITFPMSRSASLEITVKDDRGGELLSEVVVKIRNVETGQIYEEMIFGDFGGQFTLPAGRYEVTQLLRGGYVFAGELPTVMLAPGQQARLDLEMTGIAEATIFLKGPSGEPLRGVRVHTIPGDSPIYVSDEQGRVVVDRDEVEGSHFNSLFTLEEDEYDIPMLVASSPNLNLATIVEIPLNSPELEVELQPGFVITGKVVDELGMPLENVFVSLDADLAPHPKGWVRDPVAPPPSFPIQVCLTDYQGKYRFSGVAHGYNYQVKVVKEGTQQSPVLVTDDAGYINPNLKRNMSPAQIQSRTTMNMRRATHLLNEGQDLILVDQIVCVAANLAIAGVVMDEMGHPLPMATVKITSRAVKHPFTDQMTDAMGRFRFDQLPKGKVHVNVQYHEKIPGWYYSSLMDIEAGDEDLYIIMRPTDKKPPREIKKPAVDGGLVQFKVVERDRQIPLRAASIKVEGDRVSHRFGLFTNSQGEASVVLPPGSYVLTDVDKYGKYRKNFLNREFVASAGQVESIVVEMELLPIISGTVYDPEGKVVSGAELLTFPSTFYMSEPQFGCESQADGKFRFFWDADKAYEDKERRKYEIYLSVMHERRNLAVLLPLRQATMENIDIVLSPTGSITGIITDSAGDPVEDVEITVRRKRQSEPIGRGYGTGSSTNRNSGMVITVKTGFKVCQTDDLGRYELKGMPPLPESYQYRLHIQNCDEVIIVESEDFVAGEVLVKDVVMKR